MGIGPRFGREGPHAPALAEKIGRSLPLESIHFQVPHRHESPGLIGQTPGLPVEGHSPGVVFPGRRGLACKMLSPAQTEMGVGLTGHVITGPKQFKSQVERLHSSTIFPAVQ